MTELGAPGFEMLAEARLWARLDIVLTLLPVRARARPVVISMAGVAGPRWVGVCVTRVDDERFKQESGRDMNWSAMVVLGAGAGADSCMMSFEEVLPCVTGALPGARKELSRLGLGGGSIVLRSILLPPAAAVSSGIAAGTALSS